MPNSHEKYTFLQYFNHCRQVLFHRLSLYVFFTLLKKIGIIFFSNFANKIVWSVHKLINRDALFLSLVGNLYLKIISDHVMYCLTVYMSYYILLSNRFKKLCLNLATSF